MTGLERQQNVRARGWAVPTLTPAPAAGERPRFGLGAACAGNFHPFPWAGGCTLTPVPSPGAARGPRLASLWVRSRCRVSLPTLPQHCPPLLHPRREEQSWHRWPGITAAGIRAAGCTFDSYRTCSCIYICKLGVAPSFGELLKHSQLISAGLHAPHWERPG